MKTRKKILKLISIILILASMAIIFTSLMWMITILWGHNKADITSKQYYAAQKSNLEEIKKFTEPTTVTLYFSENLDSEYPELGVHKQYIERLLDQFQAYGNGKIKIIKKNPEPYSPAEYEAKDLGIRAFPDTENTKNLYFGAAFSNNRGQKSIIPYFSVQRQNYAEYDIMRILNKLQNFKPAKIGVVSFSGDISNWQIFKKIQADYDVRFINYRTEILPNDLSVLILFNPQQMDTNFLYGLDQYLIHGGNLIVLLDSYAEKIISKYPYTANNQVMIDNFLQNLGLSFTSDKTVGDKILSQPEYQTAISTTANPTYLNFVGEQMNIPENLGGNQIKIFFAAAGEIKATPKDDVRYTELFATGEGSGLIENKLLSKTSAKKLADLFKADNQKHILGYFLEGRFHSMFDKNLYEGTPLEALYPPYLSENIKESKILILADTDFMADESWNMSGYQKDAGVYDQIPSANNADFLLSTIDYMTGNNNLAKLKAHYLINNEKNIAEQIYIRAFNKYKPQYLQKEKETELLQQQINRFQEGLKSQKIGYSLAKIQELDALHRQQQTLQEEIKKLNYQVQQESGRIINTIVVLNLVILPGAILIMAFILLRIFIRRKKQKNLRDIDINE